MKWSTVVTTLCSAEAQELPTDDTKEEKKRKPMSCTTCWPPWWTATQDTPEKKDADVYALSRKIKSTLFDGET